MYDPEVHFALEQHLSNLAESSRAISMHFGADHPFAEVCEAISSALQIAHDLLREFDDCFDEFRRDELMESIRNIVETVERAWEVTQA